MAVLAGHAHTDHLDPALLMHRSWVTQEPLQVVGPAPVVARSRQWLDGDQTAVGFTTVTAVVGEPLTFPERDFPATREGYQAISDAIMASIASLECPPDRLP